MFVSKIRANRVECLVFLSRSISDWFVIKPSQEGFTQKIRPYRSLSRNAVPKTEIAESSWVCMLNRGPFRLHIATYPEPPP